MARKKKPKKNNRKNDREEDECFLKEEKFKTSIFL